MSSEVMAQLHKDWYSLQDARLPIPLKLPQLRPALLTCDFEDLGDASAARERVVELEEKWIGWSRRASRVASTPTAEVLDEYGAPLDGEWVSPDGSSSKRLICQGGWRLIILSEVGAETDAAATATSVLVEDTEMLGLGGAPLKYCVYWGFDAGQRPALRRLVARFMGYGVK